MSVIIKRTTNVVEALLAKPFLEGLDAFYPNFSDWYVNTVLAELKDPDNIIMLAKENGMVVGVGMGKRGEETKLRCIRVHPQYQNSGLGIRLLDTMLDRLEVRKPHCTVSEELLHQYSRLFVRRYGFHLNDVTKGQYRPQKLEYNFN